ESGRRIHFYLSGIAAGLSLYSYLAARVALFSLLSFLVLEIVLQRDRSVYRQALAFCAGAAVAAFAFFAYYLFEPGAFWARSSEVGVFTSSHPLLTVADNAVRHALMFHWKGGTFARDNFPGLPMMDPLTGVLLIAGLVILIRRIETS